MTENPGRIFHRGMAEALGVTEAELEKMGMRALARRAYDLGYEIKVNRAGGVAPGLTMTGPASGVQVGRVGK